MINNYSLGTLIRNERKKINLTVEQLADATNYSRSYLSRIENGQIVGEDIYYDLLKYFGIAYHFSNDCIDFEEMLNAIYSDIIHLRCTYEKLKNTLDLAESYKYSFLYSKVLILKLIFYVLYNQESSLERILFFNEIEELCPHLLPFEQQIIYDYLGYDSIRLNKNKANEHFEKAIALGNHGESTTILYYHLTIYNCSRGNLVQALFYGLRAHDRFSIELNHMRLYYSQLLVARIFSQNGDYAVAEKKFIKLLSSTIVSEFDKSILYFDLSINYYKCHNYSKAIETLIKNSNKNFDYYLLMILIYLSLDDIDNASSYITQCYKLELSEFQKNILSILQNKFTSELSSYEFESLLKQSFEEARKQSNYRITLFLLQEILDFYESNRMYKNANFYLKEIINDSYLSK